MVYYHRTRLLQYEIFILTVYLIFVSRAHALRIALPIYTVAAIIPFVTIPRSLDFFSLIYIFATSVYLLYGVFAQDYFESVTTYVSRILQFVIFIFLINRKEHQPPKNIVSILRLSVFLECIVDIALIFFTREGTGVRLIAGAQPVGGNIGIVILPLLIYAFYRDVAHRRTIIVCYMILLFWVSLSGTRGYFLMFAVSALAPALDYLNDAKKNSIHFYNRLFLLLILFSIIALIIIKPSLYNRLLLILRIDAGVGIRDYENQVARRFFAKTDFVHKIFGIGYGGNAAKTPGYLEAYTMMMSQFGSWAASFYLEPKGSIFHNYYSNILLVSGAVGLLLTVGIFIWGLKRIHCITYWDNSLRRGLCLYWISFFAMLYYRWSCSCGIGEMIVFSEVLRMCRYDSLTRT